MYHIEIELAFYYLKEVEYCRLFLCERNRLHAGCRDEAEHTKKMREKEMAQIFEIATENGKMFCKCKKEGGTLVLIGKGGNLSLQQFMDQVCNPNLAMKLRGQKARGAHHSENKKAGAR